MPHCSKTPTWCLVCNTLRCRYVRDRFTSRSGCIISHSRLSWVDTKAYLFIRSDETNSQLWLIPKPWLISTSAYLIFSRIWSESLSSSVQYYCCRAPTFLILAWVANGFVVRLSIGVLEAIILLVGVAVWIENFTPTGGSNSRLMPPKRIIQQ